MHKLWGKGTTKPPYPQRGARLEKHFQWRPCYSPWLRPTDSPTKTFQWLDGCTCACARNQRRHRQQSWHPAESTHAWPRWPSDHPRQLLRSINMAVSRKSWTPRETPLVTSRDGGTCTGKDWRPRGDGRSHAASTGVSVLASATELQRIKDEQASR